LDRHHLTEHFLFAKNFALCAVSNIKGQAVCIIIDANCANEFKVPTSDAVPIIEWITERGGMVATGGKQKGELIACAIRTLYRQWVLAGRVYEYDDAEIAAANDDVVAIGLRSNDSHIIALARVSNCRLLFSRDQDLHVDFKNLILLPTPRGRIYQNHNHKKLLRRAPPCSAPL
jgi:predicted nucleic acid-binding protein